MQNQVAQFRQHLDIQFGRLQSVVRRSNPLNARRTAAVIRNDGNDNAMFGAAPRPSRPAQLSRNVNSLSAL